MTAAAAPGGPKVKEIQTLNFHQTYVNHEKITSTTNQGNDKPCDRLNCDKFFVLFDDARIFHFLNTPLYKSVLQVIAKILKWSILIAKQRRTSKKTTSRKLSSRCKYTALLLLLIFLDPFQCKTPFLKLTNNQTSLFLTALNPQ